MLPDSIVFLLLSRVDDLKALVSRASFYVEALMSKYKEIRKLREFFITLLALFCTGTVLTLGIILGEQVTTHG
jgi:hypothetical protein